MEQVHKAAFRNNTLGNSLYIPQHKIGKYSPEEVSTKLNLLKLKYRVSNMITFF